MWHGRFDIHDRIMLKEIIHKMWCQCGTEFICLMIVSGGRIFINMVIKFYLQ
jgi:hypothetical protein